MLHSFYAMADGSCLAFFEAPEQPFEFKVQHDFDLHIALEIPHDDIQPWLGKASAAGMEVRGPSDHGMIDSIYFRDPNGYVIELTGKKPGHAAAMDPAQNGARRSLEQWQSDKAS